MLPNHHRNPRKPAGPGATSPPPIQRQPAPPAAIVAYEDVIAACGHTEKFGLFDDKMDKFRAERRQKVADRPCQACRERKRQDEEAAARVRHAAKQKHAQEADKDSERLPDGAKFAVAYDAARTEWTGTLTIGKKVFTESASGVFRLLQRLERQYRETLPAAPDKVG